MSAKLDRPLKPAPVPNVTPFKTGQQNAAPPKAQTFLAPKAQAPTPPARQAPKPVVTHEQLLEAFNATLKQPTDAQLTGKFLKLFVDAENPNFKDKTGACPLFALEANHRLDLIKAFVANKKFTDGGAVDEDGETVLFGAVLKRKTEKCPDPLAFVTELLKIVPVKKMDHEGVTVEAYLLKEIATLEKRIAASKKALPTTAQAKVAELMKKIESSEKELAYLRDSVLPVIKAKIGEENAAFEAEYQSRLKVIMRRIDQTERDELANNKRVLFRPQDIAAADAQSKRFCSQLREQLPERLRIQMEAKQTMDMLTNPERIEYLRPKVENNFREFQDSLDRLSADPKEDGNRQLSNSPTGLDYSGKLLK